MIGEIDEDASSHTTGRMRGRNGGVQIALRVSARRSWSLEQKLRIIGEAFSPGSSVMQACERHDVSTGQLYTWRKQLLDGELCGPGRAVPQFAQVKLDQATLALESPPLIGAAILTVAKADTPVAAARTHDKAGGQSGLIEIELRSGAKVRIGTDVAMEALGRVLDMLERR